MQPEMQVHSKITSKKHALLALFCQHTVETDPNPNLNILHMPPCIQVPLKTGQHLTVGNSGH